MNLSTKYIAKRKKSASSQAFHTTADAVYESPRAWKFNRAKHLYLIYKSIQKRHGVSWIIPYSGDKRTRTCFSKLAKQFELYEKLGMSIDEVEFILAQKIYYKDKLNPRRLISKSSMANYRVFLEIKRLQYVEMKKMEQKSYDRENITILSSIRKQPKNEVVKLLKAYDLL